MSINQLDDADRQTQADIRNFANDLVWFNYGTGDETPVYTYISGTQFKVPGADVTAKYAVGARVRAVGSSTGTIYGVITASSYSDPDTLCTVTWDSGSLQSETLTISASAVLNLHLPGYGGLAMYLDADLDTYIISSSLDIIQVYCNSSETLRITESALLVGKTAVDAGITAGFEVRTDGRTYTTRSGGAAIIANRTTDAGDVIQIEDDSTKVGAIGTDGTNMTIDSAKLTTTASIAGTSWDITGLGTINATDIGDIIPTTASGRIDIGGDKRVLFGEDSYASGTVSVSFSPAFSGTPMVLATIVGGAQDRFTMVNNRSTSGADINVYRITDAGLGGSGTVQWIAIGDR